MDFVFNFVFMFISPLKHYNKQTVCVSLNTVNVFLWYYLWRQCAK